MFQQVRNNRNGFAKIILLLLMPAAIVLSISPVSADTGITITAGGDQSYYLGEEVYLSGSNSDSEYTYLFMVNADIAGNGGKLTSPHQNVTSGNADSFDRVQIKPDKTWEYTFYTSNLGLNPGRYIVYAVSQPKTKDQLDGIKSDNVSIILKKSLFLQRSLHLRFPKDSPSRSPGWLKVIPVLSISGFSETITSTIQRYHRVLIRHIHLMPVQKSREIFPKDNVISSSSTRCRITSPISSVTGTG